MNQRAAAFLFNKTKKAQNVRVGGDKSPPLAQVGAGRRHRNVEPALQLQVDHHDDRKRDIDKRRRLGLRVASRCVV